MPKYAIDHVFDEVAHRAERLLARGFHFKLSRRRMDDLWLVQQIARDIEKGLNVSDLIRRLLIDYYRAREGAGGVLAPSSIGLPAPMANNGNGHGMPNAKPEEEREDPDDELVKRMTGMDFEF
jgi:hypothetical protein